MTKRNILLGVMEHENTDTAEKWIIPSYSGRFLLVDINNTVLRFSNLETLKKNISLTAQ